MNRRTLIKTIGASPLISTVGTVSASIQDDEHDDEYPPTYTTVLLPEIDVQLLHISIQDGHLVNSNWIRVKSEDRLVSIDIRDLEPSDRGTWTLKNWLIQPEAIEKVTVGGVEGLSWDNLTVERWALFFDDVTENAGYVGVYCEDPVTIDVAGDEYVCEPNGWTQVQVETQDVGDVKVWTQRDSEQTKIPLYELEDWRWFDFAD